MASMAVGRLLSEKGDQVFNAACREFAALFARHYVPGKGVLMQGKAWLVSAIS